MKLFFYKLYLFEPSTLQSEQLYEACLTLLKHSSGEKKGIFLFLEAREKGGDGLFFGKNKRNRRESYQTRGLHRGIRAVRITHA